MVHSKLRVAAATLSLSLALSAAPALADGLSVQQLGPTLAPASVDLGPTTPTISIKAASLADAQAVAARHGVTVERSFPWIGWYELTSPQGTTDGRDFAKAVAGDPEVKDTDAVAPGESIEPQFTPRDPAFEPSFMITGPVSGAQLQGEWHLAKANFPAAWDISKGTGVLIGIVDSEFYTEHADLSPKVRNPYNTASGTPNYHTGDLKAENAQQLHGTHVAGIAAAVTDNGLGVAGAGMDANFVPVRINTSFQPGSGNPVDANFVTDLVEALGYLQSQGIAVVNMSLGGTRDHPPLAAAITALRNSGVTIVAAAGNFQQSNANAPIYPASYPGVIAVANTQSDNSIAPSSSNGAWVDIAAPGTDILSTWDSRDTPQNGGTIGDKPDKYNIITGTSMAAPVVTGLVALMKSARPDLTPDEVEALLKGTATDLGSAGADPQFGSGLINANAAVAAAKAYVRPVPPAPPAPPGPPADTTAPKVKLNGLTTISRNGRKVVVRFRCNEACSGTVRIRVNAKRKKSQKLLGSRKFKTIRANRTSTLTVTLNRRLKQGSKVLVEVAAKDGANNLATTRLARKLRR